MSFLDNSGDIILDAVLTDEGRRRMAKGDGSFKVVKFALMDSEIDYGEYDKDNPSGSAYFDINIMQTPIFEAFTDNGAYGGSHLISIPNPNLLYLPVLKLNQSVGAPRGSASIFRLAVDEDTEDALQTASQDGLITGLNLSETLPFVIDQGLDTGEISASNRLSEELIESQYMIMIDSKFGEIASPDSGTSEVASPVSIDDDQISSFRFAISTDPSYIKRIQSVDQANQVIEGPRGTRFSFRVKSSLELQSSTYLFTKLGGSETINSQTFLYIDSLVRIMGLTTGYSMSLPVRFIKLSN